MDPSAQDGAQAPIPRPMPREAIVAAYLAGETQQSLFCRYRISRRRLRRMLTRRGVEVRGRREAAALRGAIQKRRGPDAASPRSPRLCAEEVLQGYRQGQSPAMLAKQAGVSLTAIKTVLRRAREPVRTLKEAIAARIARLTPEQKRAMIRRCLEARARRLRAKRSLRDRHAPEKCDNLPHPERDPPSPPSPFADVRLP